MGEFALEIWLAKMESLKHDDQEKALQFALIANNPDVWLRSFYPEIYIEQRDLSDDEFVEDEFGQITIPNLEGVTVKWTDNPSPEEMEEIFKSLVGDPSGTLTAKDTMYGAGT